MPALGAAYFMLGVGANAPIGLVAPMAADLRVSEGAIAFLLSALALTYTIVAPLLQMAIGDWDRRRLVIIGLGALALGSLISALAPPSYAIQLIARVVMALGCALIGPMVTATAASIVPPERAGQALGVVLLGINFSSVLGVPLVSFIGVVAGWRFAMAGIAALCVIIIGVLLATVPARSHGLRTTPAALLSVLKDGALTPALFVTYFQMASQFATFSLIGVFLTRTFAVAQGDVPLALLLIGATGVAGSALSAFLLGRTPFNTLLTIGLGAAAVVYVWLQFPPAGHYGVLLLCGWSAVNSLCQAPQSTRLVSMAGEGRNMVLTLNAALLQCGIATGAALAGLVNDHIGVSHVPTASLLLLLGAIVLYALSRRRLARRTMFAVAGRREPN
ncbi:MAG: MFS transporter [Hyphomonadaceae bacterium]